jgi:hypothetical protein
VSIVDVVGMDDSLLSFTFTMLRVKRCFMFDLCFTCKTKRQFAFFNCLGARCDVIFNGKREREREREKDHRETEEEKVCIN